MRMVDRQWNPQRSGGGSITSERLSLVIDLQTPDNKPLSSPSGLHHMHQISVVSGPTNISMGWIIREAPRKASNELTLIIELKKQNPNQIDPLLRFRPITPTGNYKAGK